MFRPYFDEEENDPLSPFLREDPTPEMPPPEVPIDDANAEPQYVDQPVAPPAPLPSHILPFESLPNPLLEQYAEHIQNMPQREDYEPSTGRRVLATIAGGLAGLRGIDEGTKVVHEINDAPYQEAATDWQLKGKNLEQAATIEGRTLGTSVQFHLGRIKDATARKQLEARLAQIKNQYDIGMKNAKTAEERAAVLDRAQKDMAIYHKGILDVRKSEAGSHRIEANASATRAGAAVTAADAAKTRANNANKPKPLSSIDSLRVEREAQDAVLAEMPEARKFIEKDDNGRIIGWTDAPDTTLGFGHKGWTAEETQLRNRVLKRYNELRAERLRELSSREITGEPGPAIPE